MRSPTALAARVQGLPQKLGTAVQLPERVGFEQIVDRRIGERTTDEGALAGLAGAEQEDRTVSDEDLQIEDAAIISASLSLIFNEIQQL